MPRRACCPPILPAPPIYSKTNPADAPVLTLAITSNSMPLSQVEDLVDTRLAPKISQLSGVGLVTISGGQKPAVRIQANPTRSLVLRNQSRRSAHRADAGQRQRRQGQFRRPAPGLPDRRQRSAGDQRRLSQRRRGLSQRRAGHAYRRCQVVDGVENNNQAAWMNQTPAVILNVQRQPGANTISVVKSIKALLPQLEANLPDGHSGHDAYRSHHRHSSVRLRRRV